MVLAAHKGHLGQDGYSVLNILELTSPPGEQPHNASLLFRCKRSLANGPRKTLKRIHLECQAGDAEPFQEASMVPRRLIIHEFGQVEGILEIAAKYQLIASSTVFGARNDR
jgi:hypothetical protein